MIVRKNTIIFSFKVHRSSFEVKGLIKLKINSRINGRNLDNVSGCAVIKLYN